MAIGKFKIELYLDQLIKKAETIANNNKLLSKVIDKAFEKIGETTSKAFELQNQAYAMMRMLKAWYAREYTDISPTNILSLVASAIYIANPIDLIPDFIPFIGRLDDIHIDGIQLIEQIVKIYDNYLFDTEILAASIRNPLHIIKCAEAGADVVTCPLSSITGLLKHPLTDAGLAQFLSDHKKANG